MKPRFHARLALAAALLLGCQVPVSQPAPRNDGRGHTAAQPIGPSLPSSPCQPIAPHGPLAPPNHD